MGAITELLGSLPQLRVLETFAENPDDQFSAPEIEKLSGVARRSAYLILRRLAEQGVLLETKATQDDPIQRYQLNQNDIRAKYLPLLENLLVTGRLESELKGELGLNAEDPFPRIFGPEDSPTRTRFVVLDSRALSTANYPIDKESNFEVLDPQPREVRWALREQDLEVVDARASAT